MNDQIMQIAQRLIGLRDVLELEVTDVAATCGISAKEYESYETGEVDIPVSTLHRISQMYKIELSALMFGDEPHMQSYFLTRKGKGAAVERSKAYKYQSLAAGFAHRKADPFLVKVAPSDSDEVHLNSHHGQEFNMVIEGRMRLVIGEKELVLEEGDSIYFDASRLHGMKALDGKTLKFLAMII